MIDLFEEEKVPFEFQIFALAFTEKDAITRFKDELPPEMVGLPGGDLGLHEFYSALLNFHAKTNLNPVDEVAFKSWLTYETDICDVLGGEGAVGILINQMLAVPPSTVDAVVKTLRYRANKRTQMANMQTLSQLISKKGTRTDQELGQISYLTDQIRSIELELDYDPLDQVRTSTDLSSEAYDLMEIPSFLPTPFKEYNKALGYTEEGGYFRGAVHTVVAKSGLGKSTFVKGLSNHWLDEGYKVLYVNFEEAKAHFERILMTQIIGENVYAKASKWDDIQKMERVKKYQKRLAAWGDRFMVRHDHDSLYFEDLESWIRQLAADPDRKPDVVIIDTIQSMFIKNKKTARHFEFEEMMVRLERLAADLDVVVVITAQQNLQQLREKREIVDQADMGGGVTIVQKSSIVTFLVEKKGSMDGLDDGLMQLQIAKNRITGNASALDPPIVQYDDETKSYSDFDMSSIDTSGFVDIFGPEEFNVG